MRKAASLLLLLALAFPSPAPAQVKVGLSPEAGLGGMPLSPAPGLAVPALQFSPLSLSAASLTPSLGAPAPAPALAILPAAAKAVSIVPAASAALAPNAASALRGAPALSAEKSLELLSAPSVGDEKDAAGARSASAKAWDGAAPSIEDGGLLDRARAEIAPLFAGGEHLALEGADQDDRAEREIIRRARALPGRSVIFLGAPTAAGKSTLARGLAEALGSRLKVLSVDRYFKEKASQPAGIDGNPDFDRPESLRLDRAARDIRTLLAGGRVELPRYEWQEFRFRDDTGEYLQLGPDDVLAVDSIYAGHETLTSAARGHEALDVFIYAPAVIRLKRRLKRDRAERGAAMAFNLGLWGNILHDEKAFIHPLMGKSDAFLDEVSERELRELPEAYARLLAEEWAALGGEDPELTRSLKERIAESLAEDRAFRAAQAAR